MEQIVKSYLGGLESANYQSIIQLFEENAIVNSPLYGTVLAKEFYKDLFNDTSQSKITLMNIFSNITNPLIGAGQFRYDWIMKDGTNTSFECVDIFNISDTGKITELTIIYDTFGIRDAFTNLK